MAADGAALAAPPAPELARAAEGPTDVQDVQPASAPAAGAAKSGKGAKRSNKAGKKSGKQAEGADGAAKGAAAGGLTLAAHPRAARRVAQAKSWGALTGFLLGGYLSLPTHTLAAACLRALAAGTVCYVFVWFAALFLWRRLLVAELRHAEHELVAARLARRASAEAPGAGGAGPHAGAVGP